MNKKGQILALIFSLIVFTILWALVLGRLISDAAQRFIEDQALTGLSAFLIANINIWVLAGLIIGIVTVLYVGGSR